MVETFNVREVMEEYKNGNKKASTEKMCQQLRALVYKFVNQYGHDDNIREDLIQEGFTAIVSGMRNYDPERTMPVTYFSKCISNAVKDYAWKEKYKTSRYYMKTISEVKQATLDLENANIPATVENVADYISEEIAGTRETMELIYNVNHSFSLDEPDAYELEYRDEDFIMIETKETEKEFHAQLDRLDAYSFEFLYRRYGIGYEKRMTRAEMAEHYEMTNYQVDKTCSEILSRLEKYIDECDGLYERMIICDNKVLESYCRNSL